jgi:hypothetical protein
VALNSNLTHACVSERYVDTGGLDQGAIFERHFVLLYPAVQMLYILSGSDERSQIFKASLEPINVRDCEEPEEFIALAESEANARKSFLLLHLDDSYLSALTLRRL